VTGAKAFNLFYSRFSTIVRKAIRFSRMQIG
jgi:hypothetical protein